MYKNNYQTELYHYGVLGMKWGVRRYQNKDGILTDKGKKRLTKEYKKHVDKAQQEVNSRHTDRYLKVYNKVADKMNNGLIDKYNSDYAKKLGDKAKGHDYLNDEEYNAGYEKMFNEMFAKQYNKELVRDIKNNKNYQKAKELCDRYNMTSFNDLAKETEDLIKEYDK